MKHDFIEQIEALYAFINSHVDIISKRNEINKCKSFFCLSNDESLGEYYYKNIIGNRQGIVYTPLMISKYMVENTITKEDIIKNPFIKILDPACGVGNILFCVYSHLLDIYNENMKEINAVHNINLTKDNIKSHVLKNNIYGIDIDKIAIKILTIEFFYSTGIASTNFISSDYLLGPCSEKFNIIVGNPPYIGTKMMSRENHIILKEKYSEVFWDKSDISYCFFKRALETVEEQYKITFVTSRYFIESLSGKNLRNFILSKTFINEIIDFYGQRPFDGIGIDPLIIFMGCEKNKKIIVRKPKYNGNLDNNEYINKMKKIYIKQNTLSSSPWRLQDNKVLRILEKIESKCEYSLKDISTTYQGIITGCDKAFIVKQEDIVTYNLERDIIKPWIKSKHIRNYEVEKSNLYIIYTDLIYDVSKYKNTISYVSKYREKLQNRRECKNGKKPWYHLQWGRNADLFDNTKLIFPYKSSNNKFAVDKNNYFSADIYAMKINNNMKINYEQLAQILNSPVYEFYFKCFGKKLGNNLYEYYPNNILRLKIPIENSFNSQEDIYKYFRLSDQEIDTIKLKQ